MIFRNYGTVADFPSPSRIFTPPKIIGPRLAEALYFPSKDWGRAKFYMRSFLDTLEDYSGVARFAGTTIRAAVATIQARLGSTSLMVSMNSINLMCWPNTINMSHNRCYSINRLIRLPDILVSSAINLIKL